MPEDFRPTEKDRKVEDSNRKIDNAIAALEADGNGPRARDHLHALRSDEAVGLLARLFHLTGEKNENVFASAAWILMQQWSMRNVAQTSPAVTRQTQYRPPHPITDAQLHDVVSMVILATKARRPIPQMWCPMRSIIHKFQKRFAFERLQNEGCNDHLLHALGEAISTDDKEMDMNHRGMFLVVSTIATKDVGVLDKFVALDLVCLIPTIWKHHKLDRVGSTLPAFAMFHLILEHSEAGAEQILGYVGVRPIVEFMDSVFFNDLEESEWSINAVFKGFKALRALAKYAHSRQLNALSRAIHKTALEIPSEFMGVNNTRTAKAILDTFPVKFEPDTLVKPDAMSLPKAGAGCASVEISVLCGESL